MLHDELVPAFTAANIMGRKCRFISTGAGRYQECTRTVLGYARKFGLI
jgi:hypothetical protein